MLRTNTKMIKKYKKCNKFTIHRAFSHKLFTNFWYNMHAGDGRKSLPQKGNTNMKIYSETSLSSFEFWGGAKDRACYLTDREFDMIESMLEEIAPEEGYSDTAINDFFWFDFDTIVGWLGYDSEDAFFEEREGDD